MNHVIPAALPPKIDITFLPSHLRSSPKASSLYTPGVEIERPSKPLLGRLHGGACVPCLPISIAERGRMGPCRLYRARRDRVEELVLPLMRPWPYSSGARSTLAFQQVMGPETRRTRRSGPSLKVLRHRIVDLTFDEAVHERYLLRDRGGRSPPRRAERSGYRERDRIPELRHLRDIFMLNRTLPDAELHGRV